MAAQKLNNDTNGVFGVIISMSIDKESAKIRAREWALKNPERVKQNQTLWIKNNPEKRKAAKVRWRAKNPLGSWVSDRIASWRGKDPNCNLTTQYLVNLFESQAGKCYYTQNELEISGGKVRANTASLDRLDPSKGYTEGNVAWCSFFCNTMKGGLTEQEFYDFIRNILKNKDL